MGFIKSLSKIGFLFLIVSKENKQDNENTNEEAVIRGSPVAEAVARGPVGAERGAVGEAGDRPPVGHDEVGQAVGGPVTPVTLPGI